MPMEPYAGYQPQTLPAHAEAGRADAGRLAHRPGRRLRTDQPPVQRLEPSEHKESRAFDWLLDAPIPPKQALAAALLDEVLAPDDTGHPTRWPADGDHVRHLGRHMYASYDGFVPKRYLRSGCRSRRSCSPTLRHRDHLHVSLTRQGAKGTTSWYHAQVPPPA